ncbi:hypothetical protein ACFLS1_08435 [Verrucomicrobiota bacterium]
MTRKPQQSIGVITLIAMAVIALAGTVWLMQVRFRAGDIYPAYSSLRADPLGCKILYESLKQYPGVIADRNYQNLDGFELDDDTTLLFLGDTMNYYAYYHSQESTNTSSAPT